MTKSVIQCNIAPNICDISGFLRDAYFHLSHFILDASKRMLRKSLDQSIASQCFVSSYAVASLRRLRYEIVEHAIPSLRSFLGISMA